MSEDDEVDLRSEFAKLLWMAKLLWRTIRKARGKHGKALLDFWTTRKCQTRVLDNMMAAFAVNVAAAGMLFLDWMLVKSSLTSV